MSDAGRPFVDECVALFSETRREGSECPVCLGSGRGALVPCIYGHLICVRCWAALNSMEGSPVSHFGARTNMPCPLCRIDLTMKCSGLYDHHTIYGLQSMTTIWRACRISSQSVRESTRAAFIEFVATACNNLKMPGPRRSSKSSFMFFVAIVCPASSLFRKLGEDEYEWSATAVEHVREWATVVEYLLRDELHEHREKAMRIALSWFGVWSATLLNTVEIKVSCAMTKDELVLRAPRTISLRDVRKAIDTHVSEVFGKVRLDCCLVVLIGGVAWSFCLDIEKEEQLHRKGAYIIWKNVLNSTISPEIHFMRTNGYSLVPNVELCSVSFRVPSQSLPLFETTISMEIQTVPKEHAWLRKRVQDIFCFFCDGLTVGCHEFWAVHRLFVTAKVQRQNGESIMSVLVGDPDSGNKLPRRLQFVLPELTRTPLDCGYPGEPKRLREAVYFDGTVREFNAGVVEYFELCLLEFQGIQDRHPDLLAEVGYCIDRLADCRLLSRISELRTLAEKIAETHRLATHVNKLPSPHRSVCLMVADICKEVSKEYRDYSGPFLVVQEVVCNDGTLYAPMPLVRQRFPLEQRSFDVDRLNSTDGHDSDSSMPGLE